MALDNRFYAKKVQLADPDRVLITYNDKLMIEISPSELRKFHEDREMAQEVEDTLRGKKDLPKAPDEE